MKFTLNIPHDWNYTAADLMNRFADQNKRYISTCNRYFENCLYDRQTEQTFFYDHIKSENNADGTLKVTVYLYGIKSIADHTDGSHIYLKLELDGKIYEVDNYAGTDGSWKHFKTTADGTDKREKVIKAFYTLY